MISKFAFSLIVINFCLAIPVTAHVVIDQSTAPTGINTFISFRVIHGCDGSPTTGLKVLLPEGISYVVPQFKPGWTFDRTQMKTEEAQLEISWQGGPIPSDMYDRFEIETRFVDEPGSLLSFKVVQHCKVGEIRYVDIHEQNSLPWETPNPAPSIRLTSPK
ncbi:MAG: YcnI family protein [Rhodospirillaceae bacterium]